MKHTGPTRDDSTRGQDSSQADKAAVDLLNGTAEVCYQLDRNGNVVFASERALRLWNATADEVVGKSIWEILPNSFSPDNPPLFTTIPIHDGCIVLLRETDKPGLQQLPNNGDMSGHNKRSEQGVISRQAGDWEYNVDTKEFFWTDDMYNLFEVRKSSLVTPSIYIEHAVDGEKETAARVVELIRKGNESFHETFKIAINGHTKLLTITGVPVQNTNGEPAKITGSMDITGDHADSSAAESAAALETANRELHAINTELKNFAASAASSYGDTLRNLYVYFELIVAQDARSLSHSARANLRRAQSAIQRMKLLTEDIDKYLRLYDLGISKAKINAGYILQNVLSTLQPKIDQANATIDPGDPGPLYADPLLFSILLTQLLENSIKFRKLAIPLTVQVKYSHADELNSLARARTDTAYDIITISDNGIGFEEVHREKIFDLFSHLNDYKGTYKGSGIGLAVCKKIMEMHGGFISAEGEPGKGASFHCYFPAS